MAEINGSEVDCTHWLMELGRQQMDRPASWVAKPSIPKKPPAKEENPDV